MSIYIYRSETHEALRIQWIHPFSTLSRQNEISYFFGVSKFDCKSDIQQTNMQVGKRRHTEQASTSKYKFS